MIIKNLTRKSNSFGQLLSYIAEYKELREHKGNKDSFIIKHNIKGRTIKELEQKLIKNEENRVYRRANSVTMHHTILSWSKKDMIEITGAKMKIMTQKYIDLRCEKSMAIAMPHVDKTHFHVHILMSGVEIDTGQSTRVSRDHFKEIKKEMEKYQKEHYPELVYSRVNHQKTKNKERVTDKEHQLKKRNMPTEKEKIKSQLEKIYAKSTSEKNFYERIQKAGFQTYERGGKVYGITGDRNMRFASLGFDTGKIGHLDTISTRMESMREIRNENKEISMEYEVLNESNKDTEPDVNDDIEIIYENDSDTNAGNEDLEYEIEY